MEQKEKQCVSGGSGGEQMGRTRGRVVMFPLPVPGHINPMLHLADALHSKGFSITIIHSLINSPNPCNFPNFTFHLIAPDDWPAGRTPLEKLSFLYAASRDPFKAALSIILSESSSRNDCLIADPVWPFTRDVAQEFNLLRLVIRTSSLSSFLVFDSVPLLFDKGYFSLPDDQSESPVTELPPLKVKDLPSKDELDLVGGIVRGAKNSQGVIWNSFEELEGPVLAKLSENIPIPFFLIGPLNKYSLASASSFLLKEDKHSIMSWLDSQAPKSVLYVSFGSNSRLSEAEFLEIAWGLAESKVAFLWVIRDGMIQDSESTEPLPRGFLEVVRERGHVVRWAPQMEVLAHYAVGGFWSHGGWNSTMESISEGVPLICTPCIFADQKVNTVFASEAWKNALRVEKGAKREEIAKVITRLMVEKEGEQMRQRAALLKSKADRGLQKGGSSYESLERLTNFILNS